MKQHWFGAVGSVVVWVGMASVALGAEVALTVSIPSPLAEGGIALMPLRMGVVPGATAGFDTRKDVPAGPPVPSGGLETLYARIVPPPSATDQHPLSRDFREEVFPQTWIIEVTSDQTDPITLGWTASGNGNACTPVEWSMKDSFSGDQVSLSAGPGQGYQYSGSSPRTRQFIVTANASPSQLPAAPLNVWSPRQGRTTVYLAWTGAGDPAITYHVYRETDQGTTRLTPSPIAATSYVDTGLDRTKPVSYHVTAVTGSGCESPQSDGPRLTPRR